jgi:chromosome segregation ATPase
VSQTAIEQLEAHKKRLEQLNGRRIKVQGQLEAARLQYEEASAAMRELLGQMRDRQAEDGKVDAEVNSLATKQSFEAADIDKLRAVVARMEAENAAALDEFVAALNEYEGYLARIEKALVDPEAMSTLLASLPPVVSDAEAPVIEAVAAGAAALSQPAAAVAFDEDDI